MSQLAEARWLPYYTACTPDRNHLDHNRSQITFRAPEELRAWLDAQARYRFLNRSTVITDILVQAMQRSEGPRA